MAGIKIRYLPPSVQKSLDTPAQVPAQRPDVVGPIMPPEPQSFPPLELPNNPEFKYAGQEPIGMGRHAAGPSDRPGYFSHKTDKPVGATPAEQPAPDMSMQPMSVQQALSAGLPGILPPPQGQESGTPPAAAAPAQPPGPGAGPSGGSAGFGAYLAYRGMPMNLFAGGKLFPATLHDAYSELDTAILQAETPEQAAELEKWREQIPQLYREWQDSLEGQSVGIIRRQETGEQERGLLDEQGEERFSQGLDEEAGGFSDLQASVAKAQEEHQRRIAALTADRDQYLEKVRNSVDALQNEQIDGAPLHGSEQALAAIALALGTFGSVVTHTPNYAMQLVSQSVENRIRAQESTLAHKRSTLGAQFTVLDELKQRIGDEEAAREAYKAYLYDQHALWTQEHAARLGSADAMARAQAISSKLEEQADISERKVRLIATQQAMAEEEARLQAAMAYQAAVARAENAGQDPGDVVDFESKDDLSPDKYSDTVGGWIANAERRNKVEEEGRALDDLEHLYTEMIALSDNPDVKVPTSDARARAQFLALTAQNKSAVVSGQGAMAMGEQERWTNVVPSPGEWEFGVRARLDAGLQYTRALQRNLQRNSGARFGWYSTAIDPKTQKPRVVAHVIQPSAAMQQRQQQRARRGAGY